MRRSFDGLQALVGSVLQLDALPGTCSSSPMGGAIE
jgi:hypothetical protein